MNELERFETRCRLDPQTLPAIGAMLVTGLTVEQISDPQLQTHFEMMLEIDRRLRSWSPATFIGHNSIRFDEGMLRNGFYRSLLDPYLTVTKGNRRADTLRQARAFNTMRPGALTVPLSEKGKPSFQLGPLCLANGLGAFDAHDALADVEATIKLARLLAYIDRELFDHLVNLGAKRTAADFLKRKDWFISLNEMGEKPLSMTALFDDPARSNAVIAANLSVPPSEVDLSKLWAEKPVTELKVKGEPVFRQIVRNRAPMLLAPSGLDTAGFNITGGEAEAVHQWRSATTLIESAMEIQRNLPPDEPGAEVEERMYGGFFEDSDRRLMTDFVTASSWPARARLISSFRDIRLKTLAARLVAQHEPAALPSEAIERYHAWLCSRLDANDTETPWRSRALAVAELDEFVSDGRLSFERSEVWRELYRRWPNV